MAVNSRPDVLVVGGGIAGSSLAIVLASSGMDVHIVERRPRFVDRIRGEAIHAWGVSHLRSVGLLDLAIERAGAQVLPYWQRYVARVAQEPYRWADDFPDAPHGLGVDHVALQAALIDSAMFHGARIHRPANVSLTREAQGPLATMTSPQGTLSLAPKLIVGADGEHSATRRWMGGSGSLDPMHHMLGGVLVEGLGLSSDRIHQVYFEGGFSFACPTGTDLARVYLTCDPDRAMAMQRSGDTADAIVRQFRNAMPEGSTSEEYRIVGPAGFFPNSTMVASIPPNGDTVLIGDASGRNDPSQGHGLSLVFRDVVALRDLLVDTSPWTDVPDEFHAGKVRDFEVLREHAHWSERTATETGPEIDTIRDSIARSRAIDPTAGGFAGIFGAGPSGLVADDAARRHYFGLDLDLVP